MTNNGKDTWSADTYNRNAPFVYSAAYTTPVLSLLEAKPGERVIDFGCGSGELTLQINEVVSQREDGVVVGVDASENMVQKTRSNGLRNAFVSDIQDLIFPVDWNLSSQKCFDAVFSNATLHWCKKNPNGVLESVKKVLKPGGRFAAEMGGFLNCVGVRSALHEVLRKHDYNPTELDPWYFPTVEEYRDLLEAAGFIVREIGLHPRITPLPGSLYDWLITFCRYSCLKALSDQEAETIMREVEKICEVDCRNEQGKWSIMYVRLRFAAVLK
ncbi:unnamed protein product [Somion occarium]|uniref:Methyltransferase domain-containing protein n=1 Tax=Somion occarium TaxID=3059160 RepID=A0ABP1E023_9APHY